MILALYLRLSKEDKNVVDESNSITNQRHVLHKYVEDRPEFGGYELREYVDDGYSGKNFDRPGVKRLLQDVKEGKIYGIIVKDFSRFGRNYMEVGEYIEKIFPLLAIRFISVNNQFDSADYSQIVPDMDVAFENLMYDYFSEENSIKIKNDLLKKRMRGNFMATFAPFGYRKSPKNHNQLIIDEEAAQVVRQIFEKYAECGVKAEVARYLNRNKIPTPQEYAMKKGIAKHWKYENEKKFWNSTIVGRILRNPSYIGNTVFHKKEAAEVGSQKQRGFPKEEWKVCENTHEGIVSKELFEFVNRTEVKARKTKMISEGRLKKLSSESLLVGIIKCGGCRHCLTNRTERKNVYYCRHYYELKPIGCYSHNLREADVLRIIKSELCREAALAAEIKKLMEIQEEVKKEERNRQNREKMALQDKMQKSRDKNFSLYERYRAGDISQEEFFELRQQNQEWLEIYQQQMNKLEKISEQEGFENLGVFALLEGKEQELELTREMIRQLVSEIYIYDDNRLEIIFKFEDELKKAMEMAGFDTDRKK